MGDLRRFFDIRQVYARLFIVVSLSIFASVGWLSLRQSVRNNQQSRIDEDLARISQTLETRMLKGTHALRQLRTYLNLSRQDGHYEQQRFVDFTANLKLHEEIPGFGVLGFAQVVTAKEEKEFLKSARQDFPNYKIQPAGRKAPYVALRMVAPFETRVQGAVGFDFTSEESRRATIEKSLEMDDVQFTPPVFFLPKIGDQDITGFVGFLPLYSSRSEKFPLDERKSSVIGYGFITFRAREFFEGIFGPPDIRSENLAFDIVVNDRGREKVMYRRFDIPDLDGPVRVLKEFDPILSGWAIHARALPRAFNFFDSNLHNIFALVAAILICSIWWSLQVSASEMRAEESSRKQLVDSERRVKEYSRTLLKLNLSIRNVLSEISHERILPAVAANLRDGLQADAVALYLREDYEQEKEGHVYFTLRQTAGSSQLYELSDKIALQQIWEFTTLRDVLYAQHDRDVFRASHLFVKSGPVHSFIILPFVDQTEAVVGFSLFLSSRDFIDDEFMDSYLTGLLKPIGVALRNSHLYTKAQEAADSKTTFLANMSHEIRTPLGAIVGFSDLLCQGDSDEEYRQELRENIHRNTNLLTRIIDDILDFSKFELSQPVLNFKTVHLSSLVNEVQSVVHMMAHEKKIALRFEIVGGLPEQIETDDVRVKQILLNLIGNAIKFTDYGHVVVEVSYDTATARLRFKIVDTGSGISHDVRDRLFQPFSQGDNTNTRRFGGTGLGLVLSRKLAQALGGNVRLLSSEVGRGSVFELVIPTRAQEITEQFNISLNSGIEQNERDIKTALKSNRILLVEDSVDNQEIFTLFLERAGAKVDLAKSGDEALIKAATNDYDIILMDIQLPIVDGKQATRILRRRGWNKPIIALTAHALEDERLAVIQAGCDGQITKPVTGAALVFAVKRCLERGQAQIGI